VAHDGAERYRRLFAYRLEVAESHVRLVVGEVWCNSGLKQIGAGCGGKTKAATGETFSSGG
jgi:hypothetical protein